MFEIGDRVRCIDGDYEYTISEIEYLGDGRYYIWGDDLPDDKRYYDFHGTRKKNWHNPIPKFHELVTKPIYNGDGIKHKFI
jgi:hypothetical protein